jgi:hypothetical protein
MLLVGGSIFGIWSCAVQIADRKSIRRETHHAVKSIFAITAKPPNTACSGRLVRAAFLMVFPLRRVANYMTRCYAAANANR